MPPRCRWHSYDRPEGDTLTLIARFAAGRPITSPHPYSVATDG